MENFNVVELSLHEKEVIIGGGALGRVTGWVLGIFDRYVQFCEENTDMSETLMNCM